MSASTHPFFGTRQPIALAHRGGAGEGVENSPATFQRVVDLGYRWIETDLRATIDGHAVLIHDARLDRTSDARGDISALPLSYVRSATLGDGEHPITLVEALRRWPAVRFNVDVKDDGTLPAFLRAIDQSDGWGRVCAAAFSSARLRRLRALAGARLATSMGPTEVARLVAGVPGRAAGAMAAQIPPAAGPVPLVTRRFVERARRRGLHVHVWTVDDPREMHRLLNLGVHGIVTDRPTVLREVLIERGAWG